MIEPDRRGWMWSEQLGLWLGEWEGSIGRVTAIWLRFFDPRGRLVPTFDELEHQRAESAAQRADDERRLAESATQLADDDRRRNEEISAEIIRLKQLLAQKGISDEPPSS